MPWLSLIPWKIVGMVAVILGVWGYGYYGGVTHERKKQFELHQQALAAALSEQEARFKVTLNVEKSHWEKVNKTKEVVRTITKVIRDEKPNSNCNLTNGWVQRHDEAATNSVPNPSGIHHEDGSGITAAKALEHVAENYGACHEIRQIAVDCQGWIKQQQSIVTK